MSWHHHFWLSKHSLKNFHWQIYWPSSLRPLITYRVYPDEFGPTLVFLCIGPLQMRWWR
jgi:hypothetical protein